jgi:5-formyltetrahydrofolate cyclo-ligase
MINNNKKFLRKAFKEKRSKINLSQYQYLCKCIFNNLIQIKIWDKHFFHIYLSNDSKKEVSTNDIVNLLMKKNKIVVVPKICDDQLLHFEIDLNTEFAINDLGIREPIADVEFDKSLIEIIIVPLLVFDRKGHRVGYGGGFYDRFMSNAPKNVVKIGLSLFEPIDEISDINQNDIELNFVVTPSKTYSFN